MKHVDDTSPSQDAADHVADFQVVPPATCEATSVLTFGSAEYMHLRARLVALESLVTSLLSQLSERQRDEATEMARLVLPRPGASEHSITLDAAQQINHLVDRAALFAKT